MLYEVIAGDDAHELYSGDDGAKALRLYHECVVLREVKPGEGGPVLVFQDDQCIREYHPELGEYQTPLQVGTSAHASSHQQRHIAAA